MPNPTCCHKWQKPNCNLWKDDPLPWLPWSSSPSSTIRLTPQQTSSSAHWSQKWFWVVGGHCFLQNYTKLSSIIKYKKIRYGFEEYLVSECLNRIMMWSIFALLILSLNALSECLNIIIMRVSASKQTGAPGHEHDLIIREAKRQHARKQQLPKQHATK